MVQVEGEGAAGEGPVGAVALAFGDVGAWGECQLGSGRRGDWWLRLTREGEGDLQG